jgi:hypothetical protein
LVDLKKEEAAIRALAMSEKVEYTDEPIFVSGRHRAPLIGRE